MNQVPSINQQILCIATRTPQIGIEDELNAIQAVMAGHHSGFDVNIQYVTKVEQVSDAIQNRRTRPQIIHICGDGTNNGKINIPDKENSKDDELKPETLAEFFRNAGDVNYVLLNFCYSEQAAKLIAQYVQCVIGINGFIERTAAVDFSKAFYSSLEGEPLNQRGVDEAFLKGRAAAFPRTEDINRYIKLLQPKPQPEMQIIEPTEGSTVPYECKCRGTFNNLYEGASMWAYVNATKEGQFYLVLISNYPSHSTDGEWQVPLYIGVPEGDDDDYRIGFLMVDPETTSGLRAEYDKAIKEFDYFARNSLPTSGMQAFGDRAVKRQYNK